MTDVAAIARAAADKARSRRIETPEGVVVGVRLGSRSERAGAFIIDLVIVFCAQILIWLLLVLTLLGDGSEELAFAAVLLLSFFIRTGYFAYFEMAWRGTTPGKRLVGLRVINRRGGPLRPDAVIARNLVREVEVFLPLSLTASAGATGDDGWTALLALAWVGVLSLMPLFNRDLLRLGDIVAGTWVIALPKPRLAEDVAEAPAQKPDAGEGIRFTGQQLQIYGIFELQVLEDFLRQSRPDDDPSWASIADRIRVKIGYQLPAGRPPDARAFLEAFYKAQRHRLEADLAFGKRKASKHDRSGRV